MQQRKGSVAPRFRKRLEHDVLELQEAYPNIVRRGTDKNVFAMRMPSTVRKDRYNVVIVTVGEKYPIDRPDVRVSGYSFEYIYYKQNVPLKTIFSWIFEDLDNAEKDVKFRRTNFFKGRHFRITNKGVKFPSFIACHVCGQIDVAQKCSCCDTPVCSRDCFNVLH